MQSFYAPEPIANLAWSPDQRYLAGANKQDSKIYLWDVENEREVWRAEKARGSGHATNSLAFTSDGSAVVTSFLGVGRDRPEATLSLLSVRDGRLLRDVHAARPERGVNYSYNFSIDGDFAAVVLGGSRVGIFETKNWSQTNVIGPIVNQYGSSVGIRQVALDKGRDLVMFGWGSMGIATIQTWKLSENKKIAEFRPYLVSGISAMAIHRPSGRLVTGGDMTVTWPKGQGYQPGALDFSTASHDDHSALVRGWNPRTGDREIVYTEPESAQRTLSISPDGRWLAAASGGPIRENKGYATVWNLETGELRGVRIHDDNNISGVSFSPDGRRLAYAVESRIHILDLSSSIGR